MPLEPSSHSAAHPASSAITAPTTALASGATLPSTLPLEEQLEKQVASAANAIQLWTTYREHLPKYRAQRSDAAIWNATKQAVGNPIIDAGSWRRLLLDSLFASTTGKFLFTDGGELTQPMKPQDLITYRLFCDPPTETLEWKARQDAAFALAADEKALTAITDLIDRFNGASFDEALHEPDGSDHDLFTASRWYTSAVHGAQVIAKMIPKTRTVQAAFEVARLPYLSALFTTIARAAAEPDGILFVLANRPAASPHGLRATTKESFLSVVRPIYRLLPPIPFRHDPARLVSSALLLILGARLWAAGGFQWNVPSTFGGLLTGSGALALVGLILTDPLTHISRSLHARVLKDHTANRYFEALGRLREIVGWAQFIRDAATPICRGESLPISGDTIVAAEALRSIRHADRSAWVGNSITLRSGELALLTGPNEGGKTELELSLGNSLWTNRCIGAAAASRFASAPVRVRHLTPEGDVKQQSEHSRFARELEDRKAGTLLPAKFREPELWLGDEMFSSTNEAEAAELAFEQLAFAKCLHTPPATLLCTHNRTLAHLLERASAATFYQLAWHNGDPTYQLVQGIAVSSRAVDAVRRAGMGRPVLESLLEGGNGSPPAGDVAQFRELMAHLPPPPEENRP